MKCDNCVHLFVCKYHYEVVDVATRGNLNPYDFTNTEENSRKAFDTIFSILENCKYFKAT